MANICRSIYPNQQCGKPVAVLFEVFTRKKNVAIGISSGGVEIATVSWIT